MSIRLFITGGTFDKEYNELEEKLLFKDTHMGDILKQARSKLDIKIRTLMMIDSLHMTEEDRENIAQNCQKSTEDKIVITHGTGTMENTAKYLSDRIKDKTIVLTGAMVPFVLGNSDGLFNLGTALAFVQTLPHGVYIAMNGKFFHAGKVHKNTSIGVFEETT